MRIGMKRGWVGVVVVLAGSVAGAETAERVGSGKK